VTKDEWFATNDIHNMLVFAKPSERRIRLFAIACYRHAIKPEKYSSELKLAENYLSGTTHKNTLHIAYKKLDDTMSGRAKPEYCLLFTATNLDKIIKVVSHGTRVMARMADRTVERKWQANLLRHMIKIKW
jgi:hypothetical protein